MNDLLPQIVTFGHALREHGVPVDPSRMLTFCESAAILGASDLYWAGRISLVSRPDRITLYDEVFQNFFADGGVPADQDGSDNRDQLPTGATPAADHDDGGSEMATGSQELTANAVELLRHKSFGSCSSAELDQLARLMASLLSALPRRRERRYCRAPSGPMDTRRTVRLALAAGGEPVALRHRRRRQRPRRIVFLLDVSGSMTNFSRAMLLFAHVVHRACRDALAWAFGTSVTNLTSTLRGGDPSAMLCAAASAVPDWDGGTRIGESVHLLLTDSISRSAIRNATVVVCSDGLEVGDPAALEHQMERLALTAHQVFWLNPLAEDPRYEPLARGMKASMPYIDKFSSGHNLASLEQLLGDLL